jgi:hypothetical protein
MAGDGMAARRGVGISVGSGGRPIEEPLEDHRGALSMCFRRFDAGPVSTVTILSAVNKRSGRMYPVPIGSGLGEIRGLTFFCAGGDANMAEYRAYIMDKDGLISRAIGLVCPDDETAMEHAKARLRGGPRTSQAQCPRLIAPTPDGSALMILRRYCT